MNICCTEVSEIKFLELYKFELLRLITVKNIVASFFLSISSLFLSPLSTNLSSVTIVTDLSRLAIDYTNKLTYLKLSYIQQLTQLGNMLYILLPILLLSIFLYDSLSDSIIKNEIANRLMLSVPIYSYFLSKILASLSLSLLYSAVVYLSIFSLGGVFLEEILIVIAGLFMYLIIYALSITTISIVLRNIWLSIISHIFLSMYTTISVVIDINSGYFAIQSLIFLVSYGSVLLFIILYSQYFLGFIYQMYVDKLDEQVRYQLETLYNRYSTLHPNLAVVSLGVIFILGLLLFYICRRYEVYEYV